MIAIILVPNWIIIHCCKCCGPNRAPCPPFACWSLYSSDLRMWPYLESLYEDDHIKMRSLGRALFQCDWRPCKKGPCERSYTLTWRTPCGQEDGHWRAEERGLRGSLPSQPWEGARPATRWFRTPGLGDCERTHFRCLCLSCSIRALGSSSLRKLTYMTRHPKT